MEEYRVSEEYLDDLMKKASKALVGKTMKRFEILKDIKQIKKAIKELIYEHHRVLKAFIKSFSTGVKFVTKPRKAE